MASEVKFRTPRANRGPVTPVLVRVEIVCMDQEVVQELKDDLEITGWGEPASSLIRDGKTMLVYHLEVAA